MIQSLQIPGKKISPSGPVFVIAEAGVNHNGEISRALELIDVAAEAKVDAIKFQLFHTEQLVTQQAPQAAYQSKNMGQEESQFDMLKRLELPDQAFAKLKEYAESLGLIFMATPFDRSAADYLEQLGVSLFKVGSGDLTNLPLLRHIAAKGLPLIVSTGMASMDEVLAAKLVVESTGNRQLIFLHCTSNYPCPFEEVNLRAMHTLRDQTGCLVGYSDHTEGILVSVAAAAMGATVIEKHFTTDRSLPGPDHKASLEPTELKQMVRQIRQVEQIRGSAEKRPSLSEAEVAKVARKSLVAARNISKGTMLDWDMLRAKRPGTGIPPGEIDKVIGKKLNQNVSEDTLLTWEMLV